LSPISSSMASSSAITQPLLAPSRKARLVSPTETSAGLEAIAHWEQEMAEVIASLDTTAAPATAQIAGLKHRYILLMLLGAYTLSFLDRQVVTILAEPIKTDLHLSDTQVGMLTGLAFAIFYTFLGIPIARLADRFSRPVIIAVSMTLWSAFTLLSGRAQNFTVI